MSQNQFSKSNIIISFFLLVILTFFPLITYSQTLLDPDIHPKFVNPLPIPPRLDATKSKTWQMEMNQTTQWLGLENSVGDPLYTTVWGYGEVGKGVTYPGPTFVAEKNTPVKVKWYNNLPNTGHILPVDYSLHMAHPYGTNAKTFYEAGNIPTVVHLHGGHTESASDGLPEAWYTQSWADRGPQFVKKNYVYHNDQESATLWYHDHALGITRLNVYAGLAGFYLLRDNNELKLTKRKNPALPIGPYEIEIVIQDRDFKSDGELFLPAFDGDPYFDGIVDTNIEPTIVAEYFGNFILVNGSVWPKLDVEPRKYRFRLLNGSDSRVYRLSLSDGTKFWQIGTDNGLLPTLVELNYLVIAPGERIDLVIDFSGKSGSIILQNTGPDEPFKGNNWESDVSRPTGQVMKFNVGLPMNQKIAEASITSTTRLRSTISPLTQTGATRKLALFEGEDADGRLQPLLGIINGDNAKGVGGVVNGSLAWFEGITENPMLNDVEVWEVYNATEDAHPIHLHLVSFQILERRPFSAAVNSQNQIEHNGGVGIGAYIEESSINFLGPGESPAANERGWKDTFIVPPGYMGKVIAKFDREGRYVWHCHILSHEDHEMMRPYYVGPVMQKQNIADNDISNLNENVPEEYALDQNYPNPFNPETEIRFQLPESKYVEIRIYDALGKEIINLVNLESNAGYHSVKWNGRDKYGNLVPTGLYMYQIKAGDYNQIKKMMLLK